MASPASCETTVKNAAAPKEKYMQYEMCVSFDWCYVSEYSQLWSEHQAQISLFVLHDDHCAFPASPAKSRTSPVIHVSV